MKTYVAILAAGKGLRMGLSQPKQFEMLDGKTVLEHSVDTFEKHPNIDGIFVVVHDDFLDNTRRLLNVRNRPKIVDVIAGGAERMDSSRNAILALEGYVETGHAPSVRDANCNLLIHDAARPFITEKIITDVVDALKTHSVVSVAIPATDTIYTVIPAQAGISSQSTVPSVQGDSRLRGNDTLVRGNDTLPVIVSSPKRETVYLAQTPQGGRLSVLRRAFENMYGTDETSAPAGISTPLNDRNQGRWLSGAVATDDACVILHHLPSEKIHIVLGDVANRKITFRGDL